ncbi:MAG: hypothetical protein GX239_02220 [Clostridiaceae bacterium]|nr:hypothetical protein [Clostridiaceae bacterium]
MKTEIGELKLKIPRDRLGLFEQMTINSYLDLQSKR